MDSSPKEYVIGRLYMINREQAVCYGQSKPSQRPELVYDSDKRPTIKMVQVPSTVFTFVCVESLVTYSSMASTAIGEIPDEEQDPGLIRDTLEEFERDKLTQKRVGRLNELKTDRQHAINHAANFYQLMNDNLASVANKDKEIEELTALLQQ